MCDISMKVEGDCRFCRTKARNPNTLDDESSFNATAIMLRVGAFNTNPNAYTPQHSVTECKWFFERFHINKDAPNNIFG